MTSHVYTMQSINTTQCNQLIQYNAIHQRSSQCHLSIDIRGTGLHEGVLVKLDLQWERMHYDQCSLAFLCLQIDMLRPGLLGPNREVFAQRYCGRRLVPVWRAGNRTDQQKWDNSGLVRATELHLLLKQVGPALTTCLSPTACSLQCLIRKRKRTAPQICVRDYDSKYRLLCLAGTKRVPDCLNHDLHFHMLCCTRTPGPLHQMA